MSNDVRILSIESSCDETAAAVTLNGREVLSNIIYSQITFHEEYGGVVPEIASRHHLKNIPFVFDHALEVDFPPELLEKIPADKRDALLGILAQDPRPAYIDDPQRRYGFNYLTYDVRFTVDGRRLTVVEIADL